MAIGDIFKRKKQSEDGAEGKIAGGPQQNGRTVMQAGDYQLGGQRQQAPKMGADQIKVWNDALRKYKSGKHNLELRIISNEQWYKMRHWEELRKASREKGAPTDPAPTSGWLMNCIASKHADAMDSYPEPNLKPREQGDRAEAKMLSSIIPLVLEQDDFEATYDRVWWYKLISGTGAYGVFWDGAKQNGLGDISIKKINLLNLFWEPGVADIQQSKYVFYGELIDNDLLKSRYPQLEDKQLGSNIEMAKYIYDDSVDTSGKTAVWDVYYKREVSGHTVLHYAKYVGETVLYASEDMQEPFTTVKNEPAADGAGVQSTEVLERAPISVTGWYDDGEYPFVVDPLFPEEGTICGFGYVDICRDPQKYIDLLDNAIMKNALVAATPRFFLRQDGNVNEEEYADFTKTFIHTNGNLGADSIIPITTAGLSDVYVTVLGNKIDELKETSGNRDVNNGGTASGVTAASAIAALQEQSGKLSRDMIKASYRAYKEIVTKCIWRIRQFYDMPRKFRILGQYGTEEYISYSNENLKVQSQGMQFGVDMGYRLPEFDIEINAQKESPYNKMTYNELALQLYQLGFFNPQQVDQALACLDMMDFKQRDAVMQKIARNGTLAQKLAMWQQMALALAAKYEPEVAEGLAMQINSEMGAQQQPAAAGSVSAPDSGSEKKEGSTVSEARSKSQNSTKPR